MLKKLSAGPYIFWIALFTVVPMGLILFYAFTVQEGSGMSFSFANMERFLDPLFVKVLLRSFKLALEATILCLFLGYPMAMILSKLPARRKNLAVMLFVVPMWMNFLLRTYAWITILGKHGIVNAILGLWGVEPVQFLYTEGAIILGMVYNFLPFMVLPIYTVLSKMDQSLIEAAEDLGANRWTVYRKIIFPLSLPGVVSGVSMVFMPAVSTFVISKLLGGSHTMLIGNVIEQQFVEYYNQHFGSAVSMILMVLILISMALMNRVSKQDNTSVEVNLW